MFWSGNYIVVRELNSLLKDESVSLSQVLEADDILQECKADNKALMQFLTKPDVLAELITLITEEPPKHVELASQYRHASIACEVLTSHLSMLSDRLSLDTVQMNRLCDFINQDPPLNPLLASYFSKTVEMLLERSPKQDWYLYHIVCLRVLDFFKSRRDFLPNLLRHLATSAIADTFKYFIRLDDLFNKIIMEWLEEHQFLECLIQIICGTYVPEPLFEHMPRITPSPTPMAAPPADADCADVPEKAERELSEKVDVNHKESSNEDEAKAPTSTTSNSTETADGEPQPLASAFALIQAAARAMVMAAEMAEAEAERSRQAARDARSRAVASANAAGLLCDLILNGCVGDGFPTRPRTSWVLLSRLQSEHLVRLLLQSVFTSPPSARRHAVVNGCQVLRALLDQEPILVGECEAERSSVELAVAPHLPLLHQALLQNPPQALHAPEYEEGAGGEARTAAPAVGAARVHAAALLAHLAASEVQEVPTTMLTLGTPGALVELFFACPDNNFLHAQVHALLQHALANRLYRAHYADHLLVECDLLTRLMDAYEENEAKQVGGSPRSGYMGHVILMLRRLALALEDGSLQPVTLPAAALQRWAAFSQRLQPVLQQHDTPLGGYYPPENIYEFNDMATAGLDDIGEEISTDDINEMCDGGGSAQLTDGLHDAEKMTNAKSNFLELANQRFDDDMWEDSPEPESASGHDLLADVSPWESANEESQSGGEGWAQFGDVFGAQAQGGRDAAFLAAAAAPPFDDQFPQPQDFVPFWPHGAPAPAPAPASASAPAPAPAPPPAAAPAPAPAPGPADAPDTSTKELEDNMVDLRLTSDPEPSSQQQYSDPVVACTIEVIQKMRTALSGMSPDAIANLFPDIYLEESTESKDKDDKSES